MMKFLPIPSLKYQGVSFLHIFEGKLEMLNCFSKNKGIGKVNYKLNRP